jgi:hypothetical protein
MSDGRRHYFSVPTNFTTSDASSDAAGWKSADAA